MAVSDIGAERIQEDDVATLRLARRQQTSHSVKGVHLGVRIDYILIPPPRIYVLTATRIIPRRMAVRGSNGR